MEIHFCCFSRTQLIKKIRQASKHCFFFILIINDKYITQEICYIKKCSNYLDQLIALFIGSKLIITISMLMLEYCNKIILAHPFLSLRL